MVLMRSFLIAAALLLADATPTPGPTPAPTPGPMLAPTNTTTTKPPVTDGWASMMLLAGTAFIMIIFYGANAHLKFVQAHTWSMLLAAVSIFVAVSMNTVIQYIVVTVLKIDAKADPPTAFSIVASAVILVVYWAIALSLMFCFKTSLIRLKAYGTISGHIMGFGAITLWSQVAMLNPFRTSPWWIVPVLLLIYLFFTSIMLLSFKGLAIGISKADKVSKEDMDRMHDQAYDTGCDFFSLGAAWFFCTWVKFLIFGAPEPALTTPKYAHDSRSVWILMLVSVVFGILGSGLASASHYLKGNKVLDFFSTVAHTTAAMDLLDAEYWLVLPSAPSDLIGKLQVAFELTLFTAVLIFIMGVMGHLCGHVPGALKGMLLGLGLVVGSSWEKTFDASVDALGQFGFNDAKKTLVTLLLVWIVFPAWVAFILPKGDDDLKKKYKGKNPPVWAVCCDFDPCEDIDGDQDYEQPLSEEDS